MQRLARSYALAAAAANYTSAAGGRGASQPLWTASAPAARRGLASRPPSPATPPPSSASSTSSKSSSSSQTNASSGSGLQISRRRTDAKTQLEQQQVVQQIAAASSQQAASATSGGQNLGLGSSHPAHLQGPELEISNLQQQVHELWAQNKVKEAREVAEAVKLTVESFYGTNHPVYASVLNNLAILHKQAGEFEEAVKTLSEAIRVYKETVGDEHISTATAMGNLGQLYKTLALGSKGVEKHNLLTHAKTFFTESKDALKKLKGEDSPDYGMALQNYGAVLRLIGDKENSAKNVEEGKAIIIAALEPDHPRVATARNNMGLEYKLQGMFERAEAEYKEALRIRQEKLGTAHNETIITMHNLAELYVAWGREDQAKALQQQVLDELGIDEADLQDMGAGDGAAPASRG